ncbi:hypothetical protein OE88DRAFT_1648710 [Heliocybe sulcata]|uniref:Uncharacterized protein n=1 Tax=Heliocybe sulcata TaxID=5364 RepID=A0A5C3MPM1_9AGAM|nr:hypothetical protein OE88DRAFT_1648710 [Heliocybe sulcata]
MARHTRASPIDIGITALEISQAEVGARIVALMVLLMLRGGSFEECEDGMRRSARYCARMRYHDLMALKYERKGIMERKVDRKERLQLTLCRVVEASSYSHLGFAVLQILASFSPVVGSQSVAAFVPVFPSTHSVIIETLSYSALEAAQFSDICMLTMRDKREICHQRMLEAPIRGLCTDACCSASPTSMATALKGFRFSSSYYLFWIQSMFGKLPGLEETWEREAGSQSMGFMGAEMAPGGLCMVQGVRADSLQEWQAVDARDCLVMPT